MLHHGIEDPKAVSQDASGHLLVSFELKALVAVHWASLGMPT